MKKLYICLLSVSLLQMHGLQAGWFDSLTSGSFVKSLLTGVGIKVEASKQDDSAAKTKDKATTLMKAKTDKVDDLLAKLEDSQDKTLSALNDQLEAYQGNLIDYNTKIEQDSSLIGKYKDLANTSFQNSLVMSEDEYNNLSRHIDLIKAATAINYVSEIGSKSYQWAQQTIFPKSVTTNIITIAGVSVMAAYLLKKIVFKSSPIFVRTGIFFAGSACTLFCTQFYRQWNNEQGYRKELRTLIHRLAQRNCYLATELHRIDEKIANDEKLNRINLTTAQTATLAKALHTEVMGVHPNGATTEVIGLDVNDETAEVIGLDLGSAGETIV